MTRQKLQFLTLIYTLVLCGLVLAMTLTALSTPAAAKTEDPLPVRLTPVIELDSDRVLLGDVFTPLDRYADRVIARAPNPGEELVLPAAWLWRIAQTFDIDWQPGSQADYATVIRPSVVITSDEVDAALRDAFFMKTGEDDLIDLSLDTALNSLHLPLGSSPTVEVRDFEVSLQTGRFAATLTAPAGDIPLVQRTISGQFHRLVELPVPTERLPGGHIIGAHDVTWVRLRERSLGSNLVLSADQLVGQQVRRVLQAGKPVRSNEVQPPQLVKKNRSVLVTLRTNQMVLTIQGRAMENGALDDVIRIQNSHSQQIISAIVTGEGQAEVLSPDRLAMDQ